MSLQKTDLAAQGRMGTFRTAGKDGVMTKEELLEKANSLPLAPGVYLMHGKDGSVIYVGKAKKAEKPGEPVLSGRPGPQPEDPDPW